MTDRLPKGNYRLRVTLENDEQQEVGMSWDFVMPGDVSKLFEPEPDCRHKKDRPRVIREFERTIRQCAQELMELADRYSREPTLRINDRRMHDFHMLEHYAKEHGLDKDAVVQVANQWFKHESKDDDD